MLRSVVKALASRYQPLLFRNEFYKTAPKYIATSTQLYHNFSTPTQTPKILNPLINPNFKHALLQNPTILQISQNITRPVTKFSLQSGKRKTVKAVLKRFCRLDWGGWIRTKCGKHKKMWKKTSSRRRRLRQHVLVNGTQSWLLDKMVTKYWRKPKHYVDDPYAPYHQREEYFVTRRKPA